MADNENGYQMLHCSAELVESLGDFNKEDWNLYDHLVSGSIKLSRRLFAKQDNEELFLDLMNDFLATK